MLTTCPSKHIIIIHMVLEGFEYLQLGENEFLSVVCLSLHYAPFFVGQCVGGKLCSQSRKKVMGVVRMYEY